MLRDTIAAAVAAAAAAAVLLLMLMLSLDIAFDTAHYEDVFINVCRSDPNDFQIKIIWIKARSQGMPLSFQGHLDDAVR